MFLRQVCNASSRCSTQVSCDSWCSAQQQYYTEKQIVLHRIACGHCAMSTRPKLAANVPDGGADWDRFDWRHALQTVCERHPHLFHEPQIAALLNGSAEVIGCMHAGRFRNPSVQYCAAWK